MKADQLCSSNLMLRRLAENLARLWIIEAKTMLFCELKRYAANEAHGSSSHI